MINPFLTSTHWAMEESRLASIAEQAVALFDDSDADDDDDALTPYQVIDGIAIIQLNGPLLKYASYYSWIFGGTSTLYTKQILQAALDDCNVEATLIIVDSPGGEVPGTADLADVIASSEKPVWAYISDNCCSGAYWIASQADKVLCNSSARVGSIGAYCVLVDRSKLYAEAGVKVTLVKAGAYKGVGVDGTPVTQEQISDQQRGIDTIYGMFVDAVAAGRGMTSDQAMTLATGQVWQGNEVLDLGLVDGIASIDDSFEQLKGETMAGKISVFGANKLGQAAKAANAPAVTAVVETATPVVEAPKVETPAVAVEAQPAAVTAPESKNETADPVAAARAEGIASERTRLASIADLAPDHPKFVMEQFKAGADAGTAAIAYAKLLSAELKTAKAAAVTAQPERKEQAAVTLNSAEVRDSRAGGETGSKFFKLRK